MNLCLIVQSCDKYSWLWEGWYLSFKKHWTLNVPVYFVTEEMDFPYQNMAICNIKTGTKSWSDQLIYALNQVPFDNIIYSMEDMYFTGGMPDWVGLLYDFKEMEMDCLRMYPGVSNPCHPYIFEHEHTTYKHTYMKVAKGSIYSVSMSPAIWRKEFLLSCLQPGETGWEMENEGSDRLNQRNGWSVWNVKEMDMFAIDTVFKGIPNKNYTDMIRRLIK